MDNLTPITREEILMNDEPLTPITREEKILAGEDLNPVTRREYFLKKYRHAGGDVMVEGLEVTANGTYTAPEGKAYSPVEVAVPLPDNAYLLKEASGSLVSFGDGADLPMPSFICNIDAVQDLHGQDAPWVGGAGKNKYPIAIGRDSFGDNVSATHTTDNDVLTISCVSVNDSGVYATPSSSLYEASTKLTGTYTWSVDIKCDKNATIAVGYQQVGRLYVSATTQWQRVSYTAEYSGSAAIFTIYNKSGKEVSIQIKNLMIQEGKTATSYEPYSNICPISGHTGVDAWVRGKNLWSFGDITQLIDDAEFHLKAGTYTIKADVSNAGTTLVGLRMFYADDTNILVTLSNTNNYQKTFALTSDVVKINASVTNGTATNVQLELGETATTYEPYNSNSQTISVSWQTEAGEVYGGYIDLVSGVLTVDKMSITFNGTENWSYSATNNRVYRYISSNAKVPSGTDKGFIQSDKLHYSGDEIEEYGAFISSSKNLVVYAPSSITSGEQWATWLTSNNIQVVYELATPITYQLTPTQIKSLRGNNNAWCSTGDVDINYFAKEVEG